MTHQPKDQDTIEFEALTPEQIQMMIAEREAAKEQGEGIDPYNSSTRISRPDFDAWLNRK